MAQRLSQKLKTEFEAYILLMQERCSAKHDDCDSCKMVEDCRTTSDKLVSFFAESIKWKLKKNTVVIHLKSGLTRLGWDIMVIIVYGIFA